MKTTFEQQKQNSIDILLNARELSTLLDISNFVKYQKGLLEYKSLDEFQYCESNGKLTAYEEIEKLINEKIELLDKQKKK